jgi:hypothetical protein
VRTITGPWILASVLIVVCYLIARPHVGTLWYLTTDTPTAPSSEVTEQIKEAVNAALPQTGFGTLKDCFPAAERFNFVHNFHTTNERVYCAPSTRFLWGW